MAVKGEKERVRVGQHAWRFPFVTQAEVRYSTKGDKGVGAMPPCRVFKLWS